VVKELRGGIMLLGAIIVWIVATKRTEFAALKPKSIQVRQKRI